MNLKAVRLLFISAMLLVLMIACGEGTAAPLPTYTPYSTPTPVLATATQVPTALPTKSGKAEIAARSRLSANLGITEQAFAVYSTESLDWPDASLGCPQTGYSYAQVITPGYRIIFDVEGVHYRVHTNLDGSVTVLCNETTPPIPTPEVTKSFNTVSFWNEPMVPVTQKCTSSFQFTNKLVDVADVKSMGVSPGSHIAPHNHMAYWATARVEDQLQQNGEKQFSEKVQLYSPTDIFYVHMEMNARQEWGGSLYTCDGHAIMLGHTSYPSDDFNLILSQNEPEPGCDENGCMWSFPTFITAGTPLFKSSGFTAGFDFGLMLAGLTAEELQQQPGYGYSITPWRTGGSGNAVCPLDYFKEPLRSDYKKLLGDFNCGPFNQDVPGTAMGFWIDTPSPDTFPGFHSRDEWGVDEWETIWLFQDFRKAASSNYNITVGINMFGLDPGPHAEHSYIASTSGLVNRAWNDIKPGNNYCVELKVKENMSRVAEDVQNILILKLSEDGKQLTVEALQSDKCGAGPWQFQGGQRTFYR